METSERLRRRLRSRAWKRSSPSAPRCSTLRLAGLLAARWRAQRHAAPARLERRARRLRARRRRDRVGRRGRLERRRLPGLLPLRRPADGGAARRRLAAAARACGSPAPVVLVYVGLAVGVALAVPLEARSPAASIPEAQEHLALFPARVLAIAGNVAGSLALVVVAIRGLAAPPGRQRPAPGRLRARGRRQRARGARRGRDGRVHRRRCRTFVCRDRRRTLTVLTLLQTGQLLASRRQHIAARAPAAPPRPAPADRVPDLGGHVRNPFVRLLVLAGALSLALRRCRPDRAPTPRRPRRRAWRSWTQIADYRAETWRWQALMSKPSTPTLFTERRSRGRRIPALGARALAAPRRARPSASRRTRRTGAQWLCIHRYERHPGAGLGDTHRQRLLRRPADGHLASSAPTAASCCARKGTANRWTATEQMWVAERAYRSGRGFYPWPNTARNCGLI